MWGFFLTEIPQICCLYLFDFIQIKGGHYLHHFKLIIPFCIPFSKSSKIFFRLALFQLKRSKFQIWNLKKNHKKNKEKRGCSGRESKFSVTCHRTAGRC